SMAAQTGSAVLLLVVWVVAGGISLIGAAINAEIGTMMPVTGGQYMFFRNMYGPFFSFIYGWSAFSVINTASVAAIAFIFAQYTGYFIQLPRLPEATEQSFVLHIPFTGNFFPLQHLGTKLLAIIIVLLLTWANTRSVKNSGWVQLFFTVLKVAAILLLAGAIFFSGKGNWQNMWQGSNAGNMGWGAILGITAALSGAFMAFDGWNNIGFVAGEVHNPKKNIPRALFIGLGLCLFLYVLANQAYVYMMPVEQMSNSSLVATDAIAPVWGVAGASVIAIMVMLSTLGAVNGNILACARVTYAMGQQQGFFRFTGVAHPRHHTPANALWLHALLICMYIFSGTFDMLADMFVFMTWIFYAFAALGIFILRKRMPHAERPFRAWGYPVLPALFILFAVFFIGLTLYTDISNYRAGKTQVIQSVLGLLIAALGIPLYRLFKKRSNKTDVQ
ncbi:MAG: amino acid permease, partial [Dinghuibacter sp.]|nr:amino acid permease [Dinghuibacter sp.]